jgi:hypothetical protein
VTEKTEVRLEGWLPGEQQNGLNSVGAELFDAFTKAYDLGEDTTGPTLTMVVGFVEAVKANKRKDPEHKPRQTSVRFMRIEVVPPGEQYDAVRAIFDQLHDDRVGEDPLPLDDDGDVGGQPTS